MGALSKSDVALGQLEVMPSSAGLGRGAARQGEAGPGRTEPPGHRCHRHPGVNPGVKPGRAKRVSVGLRETEKTGESPAQEPPRVPRHSRKVWTAKQTDPPLRPRSQ